MEDSECANLGRSIRYEEGICENCPWLRVRGEMRASDEGPAASWEDLRGDFMVGAEDSEGFEEL